MCITCERLNEGRERYGAYAPLIADALAFERRCESALNVARQVGDADWKIEGLEEALADAREATKDLCRLARKDDLGG